MPAMAGADDAPGAEGPGELERRAAGGARDGLRRLPRVARQADVDIVGPAVQEPVAHGAADEPGLAPGQYLASRLERLACRSRARAVVHVAHATTSRGTRAEIPQVTS